MNGIMKLLQKRWARSLFLVLLEEVRDHVTQGDEKRVPDVQPKPEGTVQ